ncbi:SulP family inorganic anion transporter [Planctomicrobium piriforme]|uniref:Sulfate permease family protein n=1 Tax=Planctomicrobium piriforme TaxID=1576369 RepID=A0A1I3D2A9_9PLAN|nr:SulP family inorganic anion transporter [Planctomicrobium piriforme]SFH80890.1 Sulfate permease family protein [Planctomicrobium piriforme]
MQQVRFSADTFRQEFLASIVVFLVALPLCMGIAIASGVPASAGLISGVIGGLVVGTLAGCPLQVSGPAAGLATVIYEAVRNHGLEQLGLMVFVAGVFQLIAAVLGLGQLFRAVSPAVIKGMLAGIGVLIFASQFHVMLDDVPKGSGLQDLVTIPQAIQKAATLPQIPAGDTRQEMRAIVQELGELHRQQINLNEQVAEIVPHHQNRPPADEHMLEEFIPKQTAIQEQLGQVLVRSKALFADQPDKLERFQQLSNSARQTQEVAVDDLQRNQWAYIVPAQTEAAASLSAVQGAFKNHEFAAGIGVLTILTLVFWKSLPWKRLQIVPAPLAAIIVATGAAALWQLPILYVEVPSSLFEEIHYLNWSVITGAEWGAVLSAGAVIAALASAQTLLTATALDQLHHGERTRYNKELMAQGVGNCLCGFIGALPVAGVIVRSTANLEAGGKTRMSTILHGLWMLVFIVALGSLLRMIPTSALAAILVYTGYKLVDWRAAKEFSKYGYGELFVFLATIVVVVSVDLLIGVMTGFALAMARLAYRISRLRVIVEPPKGDHTTVRLEGAATFLKLPKLARSLEKIPNGGHVDLNINRLSYIDQASFEHLIAWSQQYEMEHGTVTADWNALDRWAHLGRRSEETEQPLSKAS